jgi:hypothetical protein
MKKTTLFIFMSVLTFTAFAQKPGSGDKLITFGLLNNTGFLVFKNYKDSLKCNRFGLTGSYITNHSETQDLYSPYASVLNKNINVLSQYNFGLFFGKQKSFGSLKNFEPYIGYDIGVNISSSTTKNRNEVTDTLYTQNGFSYNNKQSIGDYTSSKIITPVKLGVSIMPFLGFNYFVFKNFALGAEYRITVASFYYGFSGTNDYETNINGKTESHKSKTGKNFNGSSAFSGAGYITASYYFR